MWKHAVPPCLHPPAARRKLPGFIPYRRAPDKLAEYYRHLGIPAQSACPAIYLRGALRTSSDIAVFELEETDGNREFTKNGVEYLALLGVNHAIELLEGEFPPKGNAVTHQAMASPLIEYAIYDA